LRAAAAVLATVRDVTGFAILPLKRGSGQNRGKTVLPWQNGRGFAIATNTEVKLNSLVHLIDRAVASKSPTNHHIPKDDR
jgi:hypothetical protein